MAPQFEEYLEKYAEVTVKVGLNLQPGQKLLIGVPTRGSLGTAIDLAPLVRLIAKAAYQCDARLVEVLWDDDQLRLIRYQYAKRDTFEEFPTWRADAVIDAAQEGDAVLIIFSEDPELFLQEDPMLTNTVRQTALKHIKPFSELQSKNHMNWTVITAPREGWLKKVLPSLSAEDRQEKFWELLFKICRIDQPDPIEAWMEHIQNLTTRQETLNLKQYDALKLTGPGTDLTIGLPKGHIWGSARMTSHNGIPFTANIPTEEVFTIPHKSRTEGVVSSSKPLSYGPMYIDEFSLTFSEGKVIGASSRVGEDSLHKILETDEGASMLGEIALVPNSSPISQLNLLFYNTLIDENAASHIALGRAFRFAIEGGEVMSDDEFASAGGNQSLIHVDFMIGSEEMDVDGITGDGAMEPVMRAGEWAFEQR
jgi:aminopeptidase